MKERDFRIRLVSLGSDIRVMDEAVALAKEAGATFEGEMRPLPELFNYRGMVGVNDPLRHLTTEDTEEILRRCKAVEEAVEFAYNTIAVGVSGFEKDPARRVAKSILAILEGTK